MNHALKEQLDRANCLIQQGDLKEALNLMKVLAAKYPEILPIKYHIGSLYERMGNIQQAADFYQLCLRQIKKHPRRKQFREDEIRSTNSLAVALAKMGEVEKAEKLLEKSLKIDKSQVKATEQLAIVLESKKDRKAFKRFLDQKRQQFPSSRTLKNLAARNLLAHGLFEEGLQLKREATGAIQFNSEKVSIFS